MQSNVHPSLAMQDRLSAKREEAKEKLQRKLRAEQSLAESIKYAKKLLDNPVIGLSLEPNDAELHPDQVVQYALKLASSTSAPPEWRIHHPPSQHVIGMAPASSEILTYNADDPANPVSLPSMVHVSWLKEKIEIPDSKPKNEDPKEPEQTAQDSAPTKKRPRSPATEEKAKQPRIEKPPPQAPVTQQLTLDFSDDED